jgi:hypothetical protein
MPQWWEDYDPAIDDDRDDSATNEDPFAEPEPADDGDTDETGGASSRDALRQAPSRARR